MGLEFKKLVNGEGAYYIWQQVILELSKLSKQLMAWATDKFVQTVNGKSGSSITIEKGDVGLGNVDNTADADKNVAHAVSADDSDTLDGKHAEDFLLKTEHEDYASVIASSLNDLESRKVDKEEGKALSTNDFTDEDKQKLAGIEAGAQKNTVTSVAGKTGDVVIGKEDVGLGNVDNTADSDKHVAHAATADNADTLDGKQAEDFLLKSEHDEYKDMVDTALADLDSKKVDKEAGKGLSTNDYTDEEKQKLAGIEEGAQVNAPNTVIDANYVHTDNNYTTEEKQKLESIESGAQKNTVTSVVGKTGDVTINKDDVGLGNVDNTADLDKHVAHAATADDADTLDGKNAEDFLLKTEYEDYASVIASSLNDLDERKVDKEDGKGLSTNDYTDDDKAKLTGIEEGAQVNAPNTVIDANYVHTDNNYTTDEKNKLEGIEAGAQKNTVTSVAGKKGEVVLEKGDVGLGNVDNTADADKNVAHASTADDADTLDGKQAEDFLLKSEYDEYKSVVDTALADLDSKKVDKEEGKELSSNDFTDEEKQKLEGIEAGAQKNSVTSVAGRTGDVVLRKSDVGLGNVDNTADADKHVAHASTADDADTLDGKQAEDFLLKTEHDDYASVIASSLNDLESRKVDKEEGKGLSSNDYTDEEKNKLEGIEAGAQKNTVTSVSGKTGDVVLEKGDVGLGNVDNTADADKHVAHAATADDADTLDGKQADDFLLKSEHEAYAESVSTAITSLETNKADKDALTNLDERKVDKVDGKDLSSNDYTDADKQKLTGIEAGAQVNAPNTVVDANYVHTDNNYTTAEKNKLAGIETGAQKNTVTSVAGKTGAVVLRKGDVGLVNVDNTADADKHVAHSSTADDADTLDGNHAEDFMTKSEHDEYEETIATALTDLDNRKIEASDIPTIGNGALHIKVNGTELTPEGGIFTANKSGDSTVDLSNSLATRPEINTLGSKVESINTSVAGLTAATQIKNPFDDSDEGDEETTESNKEPFTNKMGTITLNFWTKVKYTGLPVYSVWVNHVADVVESLGGVSYCYDIVLMIGVPDSIMSSVGFTLGSPKTFFIRGVNRNNKVCEKFDVRGNGNINTARATVTGGYMNLQCRLKLHGGDSGTGNAIMEEAKNGSFDAYLCLRQTP